MPDALSSTNKLDIEPCNLIFGETDYFNLLVNIQFLPASSNPASRKCVILKIVYRICSGMIVHKSFAVACIASPNDRGVTTCKSKWFSTFTEGLRRFATWLTENKLQRCVYGIHGQILNSDLQHSGVHLPHRPCPQILKSDSKQENNKKDTIQNSIARLTDPAHREVSVEGSFYILKRQGYLMTAPPTA